jgi:hypothetical protein
VKKKARTQAGKDTRPVRVAGSAPLDSIEAIEVVGEPGEIIARPDGYHCIEPDGRQEFGPFETLEAAQSYADATDESAPAPDEALREVESEIGIADWIDPETGEPAEGQCPPHPGEE